jgi:hypothetical protein
MRVRVEPMRQPSNGLWGRSGRGVARHRRRASVVVQVALSLTFLIGFAALTIDIGTMYVARAELQRSADAAAMAAADQLSTTDMAEMLAKAKAAAQDAAIRNAVLGKYAPLDVGSDIEFGKAVYDEATGRFVFSAGTTPYDAVRVTTSRSAGSSGGPLHLGFAKLFGQETKDVEAKATAMLIPRDIAVVIDLSGSMCYDSQLRSWNRTDGGYQNTRDVWCSLNGPPPNKPYLPGPETATQYTSDTGPTIGWMNTWGSALNPSTYAAASDAGLWYIKKAQNTVNSVISGKLSGAGYISTEISAIMSGSSDSSKPAHWQRRCGVMLGLASWKSGKSGGKPGGNGDNILDSSEVTWIGYPSWRVNWTWTDYVDWVQDNSTAAGSTFKMRYGLKTFMDWVLNQNWQHNQTLLQNTPEMPITAVKDAVQTMIDTISESDALDHLSLHVFGTTAKNEVLLTQNIQQVPDTLYARQAAHYDPTTNIGSGLMLAINELKSVRARPNATKMIVLMTDGVPNVGETGTSSTSAGIAWAYKAAEKAASEGFTVNVISVGYLVDLSVTKKIAALGNGQEFEAIGNPEEYTEELEKIFRHLGGKRTVALIE